MAATIEFIGRDRVQAVIDALERRFQGLEDRLQGIANTSATFSTNFTGQAAAMVASWFTIDRGIQAAIDSIRTYEKNLAEARDRTEELARSSVAFINIQQQDALQRQQRALELGASFGLDPISQGEDIQGIVQGIQSQRGMDFQAGMRGAREVFAATQFGVPLDKAAEAEILGAGALAPPGETVRAFVRAGDLSGRTAAATIGGARGLLDFGGDVTAAAGAASIIAGLKTVQEIGTAVRNTGIELQSGRPVDEFLLSRGIQEDTRLGRLRALHKLGITDTEQLTKQVGVPDERAAPLAGILTNFAAFEANMADIAVRQRDPDFFAAAMGEVVRKSPQIGTALAAGRSRAETQLAQVQDPALVGENLRRQHLAQALRESGIEQGLFLDLLDSEGRLKYGDFVTYLGVLMSGITPGQGGISGVFNAETRFSQLMSQAVSQGVSQQADVATGER